MFLSRKFQILTASLLLFGLSPLFAEVRVEKIDELSPREIAVKASLDIKSDVSFEKFKSCIPRESFVFPESLSEELEKKIFLESELEDLMNCSTEKCAFNFLPYELEFLSKLKSAEKRKAAYFNFFKNRTRGLTPMNPRNDDLLIRSKDKAFDFCEGKELNELLDKRPLKDTAYRMSQVRYDTRMRPTTRLLQGEFFKTAKNNFCFAEAFIFSDHYDADRVELWQLSKSPNTTTSNLQLQIRHRIDFLHTWFRRLQKGGLRDKLAEVAQSQLMEASECLKRP